MGINQVISQYPGDLCRRGTISEGSVRSTARTHSVGVSPHLRPLTIPVAPGLGRSPASPSTLDRVHVWIADDRDVRPEVLVQKLFHAPGTRLRKRRQR